MPGGLRMKKIITLAVLSVLLVGCGNKKEVKSEQTNQAVTSQQITQPSASNNVEGLQGVQGTQNLKNTEPNNPANRNWEFVADIDNEVKSYMDYSSIDKQRHRVWTKLDYVAGESKGLIAVDYIEADCGQNETRFLKEYFIRDGAVVEEHPRPSMWRKAPKKSFHGYVLDYVCGRVD